MPLYVCDAPVTGVGKGVSLSFPAGAEFRGDADQNEFRVSDFKTISLCPPTISAKTISFSLKPWDLRNISEIKETTQ